MTTKDDILKRVESQGYTPRKMEQLAQDLGVPKEDWDEFEEQLRELAKTGRIAPLTNGEWDDPARHDMLVGWLERKQRGFGFILPADETIEEDMFVAGRHQHGAMNGDLVLAKYHSKKSKSKKRSGKGPSGEIVKILERGHEEHIGTFQPGGKYARVAPDDPNMSRDILIPKGKRQDASRDDKVLVHITHWPRPNRSDDNALGKVVEVVGQEGDPDVDFMSVVLQFDIPHEFPPEVENEAGQIPHTLSDEHTSDREDLTDLVTVAIDPETARDRDDAISLEVDEDTGHRIVWVHITDVSNWVKPGSTLNDEARRRGNSVYLVSDFVPMIPREATQKALSLAEDTERVAKSVALEFDEDANLLHYDIHRSVVQLNKEMTYNEVQEMLDIADGTSPQAASEESTGFGEGLFLEDERDARAHAKWSDGVWDTVVGLDALARQLRQKRQERGSIDLDVPEYDVRVDDDGRVTAVFQTERDRSHDLVEEFMLQANQAVARFLNDNNLPGIYRVHEAPEEEDLEAFADFIENVMEKRVDPHDRHQIQDLLDEVAETNISAAVNMELLRCMQRAHYAAESSPHFALQFSHYLHFTSPIRRYPDLVVNQILDQHFAGTVYDSDVNWTSETPAIATHCSRTEERADNAEREIVKLKLLRFLEQEGAHGEVFDAVITGVMEFGLFTQLQEYSVEGLIKVASLQDDYYEFDEDNRLLVGKKHDRVFRLGQPVQVTIDSLDISRRELDLQLVD